MRKLVTAVSLAILAVLVSGAGADPLDSSHATVTLGLGTPVGEVGGELVYVAHPRFEIAVGGGWSVFSGPQLAAMPRLRQRVGGAVVTLGAGISGGHYTQVGFWDHPTFDMTAVWVNGEIGIETLIWGGLRPRAFAGVGGIAAHWDLMKSGDGTYPNEPGWALPYAGVSVGYSF
jgi:hypothetical protein